MKMYSHYRFPLSSYQLGEKRTPLNCPFTKFTAERKHTAAARNARAKGEEKISQGKNLMVEGRIVCLRENNSFD